MLFCYISCLLIIVQNRGVRSELTEVPKNAVAWEQKLLDAIDMTCASDYQNRLRWDVHKNDSGNNVLYNGYYLRPDAASYCTVVTDYLGKCYLRLKTIAEVATTYICIEPGSLHEASAELIWIKSDPICNNRSADDTVNLTCSIEFRGNWAPTMVWKEQSSHGDMFLSVGVNTTTITGQHVTSTLIMPVQEGRRNYTCITKFDIRGKPAKTTAANVPDYNHEWMAVLSKTQDQTFEGKPVIGGFVVPLIIGSLIVTASVPVIGLLLVRIVGFRVRKKRQRGIPCHAHEKKQCPEENLDISCFQASPCVSYHKTVVSPSKHLSLAGVNVRCARLDVARGLMSTSGLPEKEVGY